MSELNVEAEIRIAEFVDEWANDGRSVEETLREAMRWAYADCVRVCRERSANDPDDPTYDSAVEACAEAIEARAK